MRRKKLKQINDLKEVILKRHHQSFSESMCLFCGVTNDVSNLCAGGTQHATSKKITRKIELLVIISGDKLQSSRTAVFSVFFLLGRLETKK